MTTSTDIVNRALQLCGTRTTVTSLAEQSNEAFQANLVYATATDWCFSAANWNFARKSVVLTQTKSIAPPVTTWTPSTQPTPPWLFEYLLPNDFIRAIYLTNQDHDTTANFNGQPKRFAIATDIITAVQQSVLLCNESSAILIYTSRVSDPTLWPPYFERFAVATLASQLVMQLNGDKAWVKQVQEMFISNFKMAEQINREEGLVFADTTPEWIVALGIDYPFRRGQVDNPATQSKRGRQQQDDDQR